MAELSKGGRSIGEMMSSAMTRLCASANETERMRGYLQRSINTEQGPGL